MPCRSDFPDNYNPNSYQDAERLSSMKNELDKVTRLLCSASKVLTSKQIASLGAEFHQWKKKHDEADRKRQEEEESSRKREVNDTKRQIQSLQKKLKDLGE